MWKDKSYLYYFVMTINLIIRILQSMCDVFRKQSAKVNIGKSESKRSNKYLIYHIVAPGFDLEQ